MFEVFGGFSKQRACCPRYAVTTVEQDLGEGWYPGPNGCEFGRLAKHFVCGGVLNIAKLSYRVSRVVGSGLLYGWCESNV